MPELEHGQVKQALLEYIRELFEEIETEVARSHEEKYALLEDLLGSAGDVDETKVAFEQWYVEHSDDLELDYGLEDLWDNAMDKLSDLIG